MMQRLKGTRLVSISHGIENDVSLEFEGCILAAYNPWKATPELEQLVGRSDEAVATDANELALSFADGGIFVVSLRASDYRGPEAFSAHFKDGPIVVE